MHNPEVEFVFLFDRDFDRRFLFSHNITPEILSPPARHPILHYLWFERCVGRAIKRHKPDLFLSPDGYLCLKGSVKQLAVIHDLNFEHYPENLPLVSRYYYRYYFPRFARKASRIVTVSEFSKRDIIETYGIEGEKIDVVYNGANEGFQPVSEEVKSATRAKYTGNSAYFVFIGSLNPRKNISGILRAYDRFRENSGELRLLIVGERMFWSRDIERTYRGMKYRDGVDFVGRISSGEVNRVIGSAEALLFPSILEGFGIPIVEAFRCGVPVITSNITSMPEVAGDSALLVDPFSDESISDGMLRIINEPGLRAELIARGNIRKELFTWDSSAEGLWSSVLKTVNQ